MQRWRNTAEEHGTSLEIVGDGHGMLTWAARADVDRAIDAMVENAVLYSPGGSTITLAPGRGRIDIDDEGPGLGEGEEEAVFERFRRGQAGKRGPAGTGLGLPIARELARRWGGDASIANRDGHGTRATLRFPLFTNSSPSDR